MCEGGEAVLGSCRHRGRPCCKYSCWSCQHAGPLCWLLSLHWSLIHGIHVQWPPSLTSIMWEELLFIQPAPCRFLQEEGACASPSDSSGSGPHAAPSSLNIRRSLKDTSFISVCGEKKFHCWRTGCYDLMSLSLLIWLSQPFFHTGQNRFMPLTVIALKSVSELYFEIIHECIYVLKLL